MRMSTLRPSCAQLAAIAITFISAAHAATYTSIPSPNLDLSQLGRVAIAGDFDSISLYTYEGQSENSFNTNGSQSLLTRYPNGAFQSLAASDAYIETMCPFVQKDGSLAGVVVGGNFTSLGGVQAQGIALWNPNTAEITPLPGLSGRVSSLYCDPDSATVYVGGSFSGGNSTNAMAWTTGWTNLPFAGFNGPVTSITKAPNGNIVFGGIFDGLGNTTTPTDKDGQVINLSSGNITASSSSNTTGFSDPSNIICKTATEQGSGNSWLLADGTAGYWSAAFGFGFNPTKIRLYNTAQDGRGTKSFHFTALPINGIMNLTYIDTDGHNASCTLDCPLPQGNTTYQDFHFVNSIGMNQFRIDITSWYGAGGGLDGIELFQDDIYSFAIAEFNEPLCDGVSKTAATATSTGPWQSTTSGNSTSEYLTATLVGNDIGIDSASVVFKPDIKQSGNYSITMYTPGCIQDNTCSTRGIVNVTGSMTTERAAVTTLLYQTNDYDKYDQIYYGYVDITSDDFRPTVTLTPSSGQSGPLTVVAQRVRFEILASTGGLNGIYSYNPNEATVSTDFSASPVDAAGMSLSLGAAVNTLAVYEDSLFVGGNFSTTAINNIFSIGSANATSLANSGLNSQVLTSYQNGSLLYVGGNFTNTGDNSVAGLGGVAAYSIPDNTWQPLGAGVDGSVYAIVPMTLNITKGVVTDVVALTGQFSEINAFGANASLSATGFAVWVPSRGNWLHNLPDSTIAISGQLLTQTEVPGFTPLYAGAISSQSLSSSDAVAMSGSGQPSLASLGLNITATTSQTTTSALAKRANGGGTNITGVATGLFYEKNGLNVTIFGGHFAATSSSGSSINNLLFLNNTGSQVVTGIPETIDADSTFLAMDAQGTSLFAGGTVSGTANSNSINGLIVYDLSTAALAASQPPALSGSSVTVNAIAAQPSGTNVYVGGSFTNAGSLSCGTLCAYDTATSQWNSPGSGLSGTVSTMSWASNTQLIIAGNLTAGGNATSMATYDSKTQTFMEFPGASALSGPVTALCNADSTYKTFWAAGTSTNGSAFLEKYDGTSWTSVAGLGSASFIRGLQVISLTAPHDASTLVAADQVLMITGAVNVPGFGNASSVLFNGTTFQPFMLTNTAANGQGSVSRMFVGNPANFLSTSAHHIARGFIVLIGLAIALALIFLIVVAGILMERYRRRKEGYVPMQQLRPDQHDNLERIPPESLFGTLNEKEKGAKM